MQRATAASLLIIAGAVVLATQLYLGTNSPDLMASWLAGHYFASGQPDLIYAADTDYFTMLPPPEWLGYVASQGYGADVFPYLYPPIWAAAFGWLTEITEFTTVLGVAAPLNALMLAGMVWLAARMTRGMVWEPLHVALGLGFLFATLPGLIALGQDQPQILVSFLLLLALERTQNGSPVLGGAALALAAAVKVYPAIFVVFWLVQRRWRAAASFGVVGAILGVSSIALAGWPLHQTFLAQAALIRDSVLVTNLTYSFDGALAQAFWWDRLNLVQPEAAKGTNAGWYAMAKPASWSLVSTAILLAALAGLAWAFQRMRAEVLLWPLAITVIALLQPISWAYHYLPALAFFPALMARFGRVQTLVLMAVVGLLVSFQSIQWTVGLAPPLVIPQLLGTFAMTMLAGAFAWAVLRRPVEAD